MIKRKKSEAVFDVLNNSFLILFSISILYPFISQFVISVGPIEEAYRLSLHLVPKSISFDVYKTLLSSESILMGYYNTLYRIIFGTILAIIVTGLAAYSFSKKYFPNRVFWTSIIIFTMFFSGGLIPQYLLIKGLGLIDSRWSLILPAVFSPGYFILMRNYFMSLPESLEESARLDGASDFRIFSSIFIPLSKPIVATVALWLIVSHWNAYFDSLIYINTSQKQVLQVYLRKVLVEGKDLFNQFLTNNPLDEKSRRFTPEAAKSALLIITTVPILLVYPFLQKYFIKGILAGSIKG